MIKKPSVRAKGRKDRTMAPTAILPFSISHTEAVNKRAKVGSVNPLKLVMKNKGEKNTNTKQRTVLSNPNCRTILQASIAVKVLHNKLKILLPTNPN
jgi:hypothetical protein